MKTLAITLLLLVSSTAYAQQNQPVTTPGPTLQAQSNSDTAPRVDVQVGTATLHTGSGRYTVAWLPFLAPLPGTAFRTSMEMPNALALTGTAIPQRPRTRPQYVVSIR